MSTPFQNRLVGTIIVAAAAIIFLPDLLSGKKVTHQEKFSAIPTAPSTENIAKVKKFPEQKLTRLAKEKIYDEVAQDEQLSTSDHKTNNKTSNKNKASNNVTTNTPKVAEIAPKLKTRSLAKNQQLTATTKKQVDKHKTKSKNSAEASFAWVIQLGSFREQHNVDNLISTLRKNGYTAFTKPIKTRGGTLIKVFVGPELSKKSLEKQLPKLKALTKMQGKIARFKPAQ